MYNNYIESYLGEMVTLSQLMHDDPALIDRVKDAIEILVETRDHNGRVFFAGVGGGAGSASHATNDFNKITNIPTICLTENVSLLTALTNDEGWDSIFVRPMEMHHFGANDCLFVFSVNGGMPNITSGLVKAIDYAHECGGKVAGVVGRDNGYMGQHADAAIVVPILSEKRVTPHSESWQLVFNHLIVNAIAKEGVWEQ